MPSLVHREQPHAYALCTIRAKRRSSPTIARSPQRMIDGMRLLFDLAFRRNACLTASKTTPLLLDFIPI